MLCLHERVTLDLFTSFTVRTFLGNNSHNFLFLFLNNQVQVQDMKNVRRGGDPKIGKKCGPNAKVPRAIKIAEM